MDQDFHDLLERFLKGKCTPEEVEKISRWYDEIEDRTLHLRRAERTVVGAGMRANLRERLGMPGTARQRHRHLVFYRAIGVAAAALLMVASAVWYYVPVDRPATGLALEATDAVVCENVSDSTQRYELPDKSIVDLEPSGKLTFSRNLSGAKREVYLSGKAFFNIVKDPSRPFYVYAGQIATRVLGTSFFVDASAYDKRVSVKVVTGEVSVFEIAKKSQSKREKTDKTGMPKSNGVVLTPNQKVEYFVDGGHWVTGLVEDPVPVKVLDDHAHSLVFANTPIGDVLVSIRERYGIEVVTENERIANCTFTGDVSQMPLYDLLDVLCTAIGSSYEVKGTRILISGRGCQ